MGKKAIPADQHLWDFVLQEAKKRYKSWPSAYGSSWLTKEYKKRGGTFLGPLRPESGLKRWHKEKWQQADGTSCGRRSAKNKAKEDLPVCRPSIRITAETPKTWGEMTKSEKKRWTQGKMRRKKKKRISQ